MSRRNLLTLYGLALIPATALLAQQPQTSQAVQTVNAQWGNGGQVLNIRAYGAKGDGVTDDTAAIQAAINAAGSGGTVWFPPGNYLVSSTLGIGQGVRLLGLGNPATNKAGPVITASGTFPLDSPILNNLSGGVVESVRVEHLYFNCANRADGIWFNYVRSSMMQDVYVVNAADSRTVAISSISRTSNVVTVTTSNAHNLLLLGSVRISGVTDSSYNGVFQLISTASMTFTYNQAGPDGSSGGGTVQPALFGYTITGTDASANHFYSVRTISTWGGMHFTSAVSGSVIDNFVYGARMQVSDAGIFIDGQTLVNGSVQRILISGVMIDCNSTSPLAFGFKDTGYFNTLIHAVAENTSGNGTGYDLGNGRYGSYYDFLVSSGFAPQYVPASALNTTIATGSLGVTLGRVNQFLFYQASAPPAATSNTTHIFANSAGSPAGMLGYIIGAGSADDLVGRTVPQTLVSKTLAATVISTGNATEHIGQSTRDSDFAGTVTLSAGSATKTFNYPWGSSPVCIATDTTAVRPVKVSTTATTAAFVGTGSDVIAYLCVGNPSR